MIQVYPNPFTQNPLFFGTAIRNSPLSTYSHVSSTAFEVSIYNETASQYSAAFVYKAGDPESWAPFESPWTVYGAGVTGAPEYSFSLWRERTEAQFNYLNYGTDSTSKIRVGYKKGNITSVDIGPYKKNFNTNWSYINSSAIEISGVNTYDKLIIHINRDLSTPLYVFANPIDVPPPVQDAGNLASYFYVSAGIWELSTVSTLLALNDGPEYTWRLNIPYNNYTVYLAPGAYVDGTFSVRNRYNVTFSGPGVIDAGIPYYDNWWSSVGFEADPPVTDEGKLRRCPIYSFSGFSEPASYVDPSGIKLINPTIVNSIAYAGSCNFKLVDNTKLICQWPNTDGFHIKDHQSVPDADKYSSMTRTFLQTADDTTYVGGNQGGGDCLVSGCYFVSLAGCTFRTFFGDYNSYDYRNVNNHWYSAIDIDCRIYSAPAYTYLGVPIQGSYTNAVFGISPTDRKRFWYAFYDGFKDIAVTNHLFSGIRVENLIDLPIFDVGPRPYVGYDYSPIFGNLSSLIFKDITASSHPNSKFNFIRENKLFGKYDAQVKYRPHDVSFINVNINNQIITNVNKDDYFVWYNKPIARDSAYFPPELLWNGSSIADVYIIIGDSIAAGYDSKFADRVGTNYSTMPTQLTGCYIWTTSSNSFEIIKPGVNIDSGGYYPYFATGVAALESTLAWKMRQYSGQRDVYIIKYGTGGSMPFSGTSATYESQADPNNAPGFNRLDWSVSSSNEMFAGFSGLVTNAITNLTNNNKHVDLKAVIIFLGTNVPIQTAERLYNRNSVTATLGVTAVNPYKDLNLVSSLIDTGVSSLISGIGGILGTTTLDVDLSYTNYIWTLPLYENEGFYVELLNDYLKKFNDRVRFFSGIENYLSPGPLSSILLPLRITPYLPPTGVYLYDSVHYNFSGYAKMADDIYGILEQQTSSITDPDLNPDVNITFRVSETATTPYIKVNDTWKQADSYVKVNGQWKFSDPGVKISGDWKQ